MSKTTIFTAQWAQMDLRQIFPKMLLRTLAAPMRRSHGSNGLLPCTQYIGVLGDMRTHVLSAEVRLRNGQHENRSQCKTRSQCETIESNYR